MLLAGWLHLLGTSVPMLKPQYYDGVSRQLEWEQLHGIGGKLLVRGALGVVCAKGDLPSMRHPFFSSGDCYSTLRAM